MYAPLPPKPDHDALELAILDFWADNGIFDKLRAKNEGGPKFSFFDGPVTANKTLAVHTAWGRSLKDVFQRYKALQGYDQRYQNGYDCQGLWIEVGVEKELGLNSKREIEDYGLDKFAAKCREVVEWSSTELTKGSIRLGQWMDWGNDYFTFADNNIEYIWRFLQIVHQRELLYQGYRATEWCPRCGTSISAHELVGSYVDREDPSVAVRFAINERPGEYLVIWTTTPWTLPANIAVAVQPEGRYGRRANGEWVAVDLFGDDEEPMETIAGSELVGLTYTAPFDALDPNDPSEHIVIPWDEVSLEEGTGLVHIAPGCGGEDFELSRIHDLPARTPINESGEFYPDYGWLAGRAAHDVQQEIIEFLRTEGHLVETHTIHHRYPECWRCHTPLLFRLSDDWFIAVSKIRDDLRAANDEVEWTPSFGQKRMDDWLINMGDWNISRRRYYGLPLPFYPCRSCEHLTVVGSTEELKRLSGNDLSGVKELRRPWIDDVTITCEACGNEEVERIKDVGDVWLDAGIIPFSTLGWENDTFVEGGNGTGAADGLTNADLPTHQYWEEWFPADWVTEMREQTRLWFYSQLVMSVVLTGKAPYRQVLTYERMLAEDGREMHGSWGNMITAEDAFAQMGADVMRWQYSAQSLSQDLLFGFGPGDAIRTKLLTLWNSVSFFVQYADIENFAPAAFGGVERIEADDLLDRWLVARTRQLVSDAEAGYESFVSGDVIRAFESYVDDLSNWYIRRSRRRFWDGDRAALATLHASLVDALVVISPIMPFLTEHLWQLLLGPVDDAPESVHLASWPESTAPDSALLADVGLVREVVELGRRARSVAEIRLRQPLRTLLVDGADTAAPYEHIIADELRVGEIRFGPIDANEIHVLPNLPVVGKKLGPQVPKVKKALEAGDFTLRDDGSVEVLDLVLSAEEVLVSKRAKEGWVVASESTLAVAMDTTLDDDLVRKGEVYDAIHAINTARKDAGFELTDRVHVRLPSSGAGLLEHAEWIATETLADSVEVGEGDELTVLPTA
ncbi:MAG: isoleucine--tRNA ligase [Actinomycetota bacterium]